jgi:hypothetical protein
MIVADGKEQHWQVVAPFEIFVNLNRPASRLAMEAYWCAWSEGGRGAVA